MRVAFYTLGCKLNQAETESLARQFGQRGFEIVSPDDVADVYIANTCTVTHIADRKSRHWLRLARRMNSRALVIATGCYASRSPKELAVLADAVVDNGQKEHLLEIVANPLSPTSSLAPERTPSRHCESRCYRDEAIPSIAAISRTRSLTKIQDGCHSACAYCIVPKVRPDEYSVPASQIVDEIKQKAALGYKEVILTGTKVGSYRDDGIDLKRLIECILDNTDIERLHLSSLQLAEISPDLLELCRDQRLCRHFHLALQSGSESVLRRMRRGYSVDQYRRAIDLIKEKVPDVAITTDIIVGFPGETDEEFEESYAFCQQAGFANIHVFPFSPRPGTAAATMPGQIRDKARQGRNQRMLELSEACRRRFCEQFLGRTMPVLWEKETSPGSGIYSGLTSNYIRVIAQSEQRLDNQITPATLVEVRNQAMWGEIHR